MQKAFSSKSAWVSAALCGVALLGADTIAATELHGVAVLQPQPNGVQSVSASQSLPIEAVLVSPGVAVAVHQIIVDVDVSKLQGKLERALEEIRAIQEERRFQKTMEWEKGGSSGSSGSRPFEPPQDDKEFRRARREIEALSDLRDAQAKIASADVRAPADGYVIEHKLAVGQSTKKGKPVLTFLPLSKTRLSVTVDPATVEMLPSGREVLVVSTDDQSQRFRARVESTVTTSAETAVYTLVPVEPPFLLLDTEAEVILASGADIPKG